MAIDPYEPELAKRKKAFEIANNQLSVHMGHLRNKGSSEFRKQMEVTEEALKDFQEAGYALAEWLEQKSED